MPNYWISPRGEKGWAVKREGNDRASKLFDTQKQAFEHARGIAQKLG